MLIATFLLNAAPALAEQPMPESEPIAIKSLFFAPEEIADIRYAIEMYKKNANNKGSTALDEDFLSRLANSKQPADSGRYYQYPQFFLESLVYHGANNWLIWVNSQKISQENVDDKASLTVLAINENQVRLRWRPATMDRVLESWARAQNQETLVNRREGTVEFTLKPNQTFSSYVMRVLEGKQQPVTIDTHNVAVAVGENLTPEAITAPGTPTEQNDESKQGLRGLIGAYKNLDHPAETEQKP